MQLSFLILFLRIWLHLLKKSLMENSFFLQMQCDVKMLSLIIIKTLVVKNVLFGNISWCRLTKKKVGTTLSNATFKLEKDA